nr:hypothetical protein GCM10020093_040820 [Planobispora longispora]
MRAENVRMHLAVTLPRGGRVPIGDPEEGFGLLSARVRPGSGAVKGSSEDCGVETMSPTMTCQRRLVNILI